MVFRDRSEAGQRLATQLSALRGEDVVVLGLPRGGVSVAFEVASSLGAPLDVVVVRKLGVPYQPELAMGAVGEGDVLVVNEEVVRASGVSRQELALVELREREEVARRAEDFRGGRRAVPLAGKVAVVVDDGIATGASARAACQVVRAQGATRVVLAAPVAAAGSARDLLAVADEVVCVHSPADLRSVGQWYEDFTQTRDEEVHRLLALARGGGALDREVEVQTRDVSLPGRLTVPAGARGVVVFVHGSGSSRRSPRNRSVAAALNDAGLGTLLFDLLTAAEEADRGNVFDIALLGRRLADASRWLLAQPGLEDQRLGYFGASTGAAAALWAAAEPGIEIAAVVSRGGRPDLARGRLHLVRVPTLLVVGGRDNLVLGLNEEAQGLLSCENQLVVVPGASHLFSEPGALQQVSDLACDWFSTYVARVLRLPEDEDVMRPPSTAARPLR